jgi:hypothetical protein
MPWRDVAIFPSEDMKEGGRMGALFPIGQGADAEIKDKLNNAFIGPNLIALQKHSAVEQMFDGKHHLHRLAYRLKCFPPKAASGAENSRGKWFYFLKESLKGASDSTGGTVAAINRILSAATAPGSTVTRVVFEAVENSGAKSYYVSPTNDVDIQNITIGTTVFLTLICPSPLDPSNAIPDPNKPTDVDTVNGHSIEKPLPTFLSALALRKGVKKRAAKHKTTRKR